MGFAIDLVEGVSEATIKSLLAKLGRLLANEYVLLRGVRGDIQYINDEMASMQAFLADLSTAPRDHDRRLKDWMKQIRDVSYDVEDCVDDFAHRLPHDTARGDVIYCATVISWAYDVVTWWPRRDIASTIAALKARTQQIGERRIRYGVENPKSGDGGPAGTVFDAAENQQTSLQLVGTTMSMPVGVDKEIRELGMWVSIIPEGEEEDKAAPSSVTGTHQSQTKRSNSDKILKEAVQPAKIQSAKPKKQDPPNKDVLSIVGFGGVGKTTIATALYQRFGEQFDRRATVTVSQCSNIKAILRSLLSQVMPKFEDGPEQEGDAAASEKKSLGDSTMWYDVFHGADTSEDIQQMDKNQLTILLADHLKNYSYLFLIDDVWSVTTWEDINMVLPRNGKKCCRVIVTTRFQAVATACTRDKRDRVHKVVELSGDRPKQLFLEAMAESKASNGDEEKQKKVLAPARLWEMCAGLPLAIVAMAGHVACNPHRSEEEWSKVCNNLVPESAKYLAQDGVMRILSHCYNDMNAETKTCALYLSMFPKGRPISRKRLTRRWIAEGFVSQKQGLSVEDVAEAYLNHLRRRKMIRPVEHSSNGKVKSYQVHDMVLEYIVSKANEENFVTVVGGHWLTAPPTSKVRRLSLQQQHRGDSRGGNPVEGMNLSHVRSLTVSESMGNLHLLSNSLKFGIVQVLDLDGCKDLKHHDAREICKMRLLKYLSLRGTSIGKLPKKIRNLRYLETLDVRETNVTELPKTVCQLEGLVNILGGNKRTRKGLKLPEDLKKTMKALRVLSGIEIVEEEGAKPVADFHHLTDLRKLTIYKLKVSKDGSLFEVLSSSIEYLGGYSLQTLVIEDVSSGSFLESLGDLYSPPKFLTALELSGKLVKLPGWIKELDALTKLTLSVTALSSDALVQISQLNTLFSLTFSLAAQKQDPETAAIVEENKAKSDGEIVFPAGGFENFKLLRFSAPFVPLLRFSRDAMPKLERLEVRFSILEGLIGVENLSALKEMHLRVHDEAGKFTMLMVDGIKTAAKKGDGGPRVIIDRYHD